MHRYELTFIARGELAQEQVSQLCEKVLNDLSLLGAKLVDRYDWGLRLLAYPIKKQKKGFYTTFLFDGPAGIVGKIEEKMRLNESVLRFLSVAAPEEKSIRIKDKQDGDKS